MRPPRRELFADINITPLTDIFLVLMIIMMVVAPMLEYRGLDMVVTVEAPTATKKELEAKRVWVAIAADGQYTVGESLVAYEELASAIQRESAAKPDGVVIEADPESNHAVLAHAIDAAETAGITQVSVVEKTAPAKK
jgi:biopolymer transport protein ExbD